MAITNFNRTIWSTRLKMHLDTALVYGNIVNRDYEGDVRMAGTVNINQIGNVTVRSYAKNTDIEAPESLDDAQTTLVIDQQDYFNFQIDDVDKAQTDVNLMDAAMRRSAYAIGKQADTYIAGLYTGVDADNVIGSDGSPQAVTKDTAYDLLVDLAVLLDEADAPEEDRWVVIPSWYEGLLAKDDRYVGNSTGDAVRAGQPITAVRGMRVYKATSQVPTTNSGASFKVIAGWRGAIAYADQITSVEAYRPEGRFADAMKGLHTYGAKLVHAEGIAVLTVNKPS